MKDFFKHVFSSMLGFFMGLVLIFLLFLIIIVASSSGEHDELQSGSVLHIKLDKVITDRGNDFAQELDIPVFGTPGMTGLDHFIADIDKASRDERIEGIFLDVEGVAAAPSAMLDIRRALVKFKESGKWIVAFSENYSLGGYYVCSTADEIHVYPEGNLEFYGMSAELMFFKNLLDNLEIDIQVLRGPDNKYKSAVEPFMYDHISEANREQLDALLGDIWSQLLSDVSVSRGIPVGELQRIADSLIVVSPADAVTHKLADRASYRDEVIKIMQDRLGLESDDDIPSISLADYHREVVPEEETADWKAGRVAVVYAIGEIQSGEGDDQTIGSKRIARALREAREDDDVKAIVLRVNSPGGSALASDVIWRETELIRQDSIPFVVSMGDLAASGGYYISCGADKIYANPNTITGSIGVFGMLPNFQGFYENKIGLTHDYVNTAENADLWSVAKPLNDMQHQAVETSIHGIYNRFISLVADGRGMTIEEVDAIAQGRVWSGSDAIEIGLVDELGDLQDAIEAAAAMAGLDEYRTKDLPELIDPFQEMVKELMGEAALKQEFGHSAELIEKIKQVEHILSLQGVQARLPFFIEFK
ncbi:MAG: signal peptide peptidase SppA [Flavobacteriales bacterium]|nr:signal peptide peptidase SppA [Flavobacteriales bacterium]